MLDKPSSIITLDWSGEHYEPIDSLYLDYIEYCLLFWLDLK